MSAGNCSHPSHHHRLRYQRQRQQHLPRPKARAVAAAVWLAFKARSRARLRNPANLYSDLLVLQRRNQVPRQKLQGSLLLSRHCHTLLGRRRRASWLQDQTACRSMHRSGTTRHPHQNTCDRSPEDQDQAPAQRQRHAAAKQRLLMASPTRHAITLRSQQACVHRLPAPTGACRTTSIGTRRHLATAPQAMPLTTASLTDTARRRCLQRKGGVTSAGRRTYPIQRYGGCRLRRRWRSALSRVPGRARTLVCPIRWFSSGRVVRLARR